MKFHRQTNLIFIMYLQRYIIVYTRRYYKMLRCWVYGIRHIKVTMPFSHYSISSGYFTIFEVNSKHLNKSANLNFRKDFISNTFLVVLLPLQMYKLLLIFFTLYVCVCVCVSDTSYTYHIYHFQV